MNDLFETVYEIVAIPRVKDSKVNPGIFFHNGLASLRILRHRSQ
jgi:hypothetical protein